MTHLFRNVVNNPIPAILLLTIEIVLILFIIGDINNMREAQTGYEYCTNLSYLVSNISIGYFMFIFFMIVYLTYINKQYSKWSIWLFYILGISTLAYYCIANQFYRHVFGFIEMEYMDKIPSMTTTLYTGPLYWMIIGYFFIPKILKDAKKLKEEQDLTI